MLLNSHKWLAPKLGSEAHHSAPYYTMLLERPFGTQDSACLLEAPNPSLV